MTGVVSSIADDIILGNLMLAFTGVCALVAFVSGAATTAVLVNWARNRRMHSEYALSLALESVLLLLFGLLGANLETFVAVIVPATVMLLCYIMGLQNAIVTKISNSEIRTTHVTGLVTDLGIELGKLMYWNRLHVPGSAHFVAANRDKLKIHGLILSSFFTGCVTGAFGFKTFGFIAIVPLAIALLMLAITPILDDVVVYSRLMRRIFKQ